MSVLVVGLSHRSAPVPTLERAAVSGDGLIKLLRDVSQSQHVAGTFVVSTCNRVEVYAEVEKFHGGVTEISDLLARHSGIALADLVPHLYVHYEDRAVQHLLSVACGLDSMVVGESQILGQVRSSLALAREQGMLSRGLDDLGALALRTAKRAHTETGIDHAGANMVSVGLELALARLGPAGEDPDGEDPHREKPGGYGPATALAGRSVLVVGAGSMSALAVATVARLGAARIVVANRTPTRAARVAASVSGSTAALRDLPAVIADADLVISCTGSVGLVVSLEAVTAALALRAGRSQGRPLVLLDLALPRDVDPRAAGLADVTLLDLESLDAAGKAAAVSQADDLAAVRAIVAEEFAARASARQAARVAPTVVALRAKAAGVVEAELARLTGRLGTLDEHGRREVERAMRRVVDKLLHAPTVRVKELAGSPGGDSYEAALRVLFDLDPGTVAAVATADSDFVPAAAPGAGPSRAPRAARQAGGVPAAAGPTAPATGEAAP